MIRTFKYLMNGLLVLSLHVTPAIAFAQYYTGPIAGAMGGAGRASTETTDGAMINPASLVHGPQVEFSGLYQDGSPVKDQHRTSYGIVLMDNTADILFSGSFVYLKDRKVIKGDQAVDADFWSLSLAQKTIKNLSFGLSGIFLQQKAEEKFTQWNGSLGFLYTPTPALGLGFTYHHFLQADDNVPIGLQLIPEVGVGALYILGEILRFRADISRPERFNPDKHMIFAMGLESMFSNFFAFRLGYRWDNWQDSTAATLGLTFNGPRLKLDYSLSKPMKGTGDALHGVDMRLPF